MEIRTLERREREQAAGLLEAWHLAEGWTAGERFRRQAEFDPSWRDENVLTARRNGEMVALLTILPREVRLLGHVVPTGGVANLYTHPEERTKGLATLLLERACEQMRAQHLELAVVFPGVQQASPAFSTAGAWHAWGGQQTVLRVDPAVGDRDTTVEELEFARVADAGDRSMHAVKSIHAAYAASRSGTVERDDALWQASFRLTPAPREEFWIARRGGVVVAYARVAIVDDVLTVTELGRFEDGSAALARLIAKLLVPHEGDGLVPKGSRVESAEVRAFAVLPTFDDIGLTVALEHLGIRSHPVDEAKASFRCVDLDAMAARLDIDLLPEEQGDDFLRRILPPDAMVFWPADRF
jgi:GNAT superfamily N-acetyltransferase